ncbi:hypothetical protein CKM354_001290100 [Cercospora kikuchii]|uniref:Uncharacterized protein n=1 Tax=Cercospora kikuchii TaxID=84275 RepID=A0A9P3L1V9_9PEZI|nr:uncharacterized protein CKM354_001290100 [Cercospora kikuchii]GIZ49884.1 hypothetical protein CKM354_001290100 [Cercospora kikuchii]
MKLRTLSALAFAMFITSSSARSKKKVYSAPFNDGHSTKLIPCMEEIKTILEVRPHAHRHVGYRCGDSWFQFGADEENPYGNSNLKVFEMCKPDMEEAVYLAKEWFACYVTDAWAKRIIAYSPFGFQACSSNKTYDHAPCKVEWTDDN